MTVHYEYPVSQLPEDLRKGLPSDGHVNITVESTDSGLPGFTRAQVDHLLGDIDLDNDEGTVIETREQGEQFFEDIRIRALKRHEKFKEESALLRKLG